MQKYTIKSAFAERTLYAGTFRSYTDCVETAISEKVNLTGADFKDANLLNGELDGADFTDADFTGANLTGTNLSEAIVRNANFTNTLMHGTILCGSDLTLAQFEGTLFGANEVAGASLRECAFSTLSALTLRFDEALSLAGARFTNPCGIACPMSRPPLILNGLSHLVAVMDRHIKVGHHVFALEALPEWISSGGLNPGNLRVRLEQITLALMMDDKRRKIA